MTGRSIFLEAELNFLDVPNMFGQITFGLWY